VNRSEWQSLSRAHRKFLIVEEIFGSTLFNFSFNAGIAWFLNRNAMHVPMWGGNSIGVDVLSTAFIMSLFTALIAAIGVRLQVRYGRLPILADAESRSSTIARRSAVTRAVLLGVLSVFVIALPTLGIFSLVGVAQFSKWHFILWKGAYAAGCGAIVTPILGWWELLAASRRMGGGH
jgi:hypothetical protein